MPILRLLYWLEDNLPGLFLALMTLLVLVDVTGRYVLDMTFAGAAEVATALFVWLVFLGSAGAVRKLQHIGIEGLTPYIPKAIQPWLQMAVSGSIFAVSIHMARISFALSMSSWEREIDMVGIPYFYVYIVIPLSFALIAFHSLVQILDILKNRGEAECVRIKTRTDAEV